MDSASCPHLDYNHTTSNLVRSFYSVARPVADPLMKEGLRLIEAQLCIAWLDLQMLHWEADVEEGH
jgi:hypothetical protein